MNEQLPVVCVHSTTKFLERVYEKVTGIISHGRLPSHRFEKREQPILTISLRVLFHADKHLHRHAARSDNSGSMDGLELSADLAKHCSGIISPGRYLCGERPDLLLPDRGASSLRKEHERQGKHQRIGWTVRDHQRK